MKANQFHQGCLWHLGQKLKKITRNLTRTRLVTFGSILSVMFLSMNSACSDEHVRVTDIAGVWVGTDMREYTIQSLPEGQVSVRITGPERSPTYTMGDNVASIEYIGAELIRDLEYKGQFEPDYFTALAALDSVKYFDQRIDKRGIILQDLVKQYKNFHSNIELKIIGKNKIEATRFLTSIWWDVPYSELRVDERAAKETAILTRKGDDPAPAEKADPGQDASAGTDPSGEDVVSTEDTDNLPSTEADIDWDELLAEPEFPDTEPDWEEYISSKIALPGGYEIVRYTTGNTSTEEIRNQNGETVLRKDFDTTTQRLKGISFNSSYHPSGKVARLTNHDFSESGSVSSEVITYTEEGEYKYKGLIHSALGEWVVFRWNSDTRKFEPKKGRVNPGDIRRFTWDRNNMKWRESP